MCELILYVGMAILGIVTLVTGKIKLTNTRIVLGWPARLIGVILLLPFPLALLIGVVVVAVVVGGGPPETLQQRMPAWVGFLGFGMAALCAIASVILAAMTAQPVKKARREEDDYPPRRADRDDRGDDYPPRGGGGGGIRRGDEGYSPREG